MARRKTEPDQAQFGDNWGPLSQPVQPAKPAALTGDGPCMVAVRAGLLVKQRYQAGELTESEYQLQIKAIAKGVE